MRETPATALSVLLLASTALAQGSWHHVPAPGETPIANPATEMLAYHTGLAQQLMAQVPANGSLVLYAWDGATWSAAPNGAMAFWNVGGLAFDPVRQRLVVANGATFSNPGQVREWTPGGWVWKANHTLPIHDLCWYPPTQSVVTWNTTGIWQWNGSTWTVIPGTAHAQAQGLALAFDPLRAVLVGCTNYGSTTGNTLEWDGSTVHHTVTTPILHDISFSPEFAGVIGVNSFVNATQRWDPVASKWRAMTSSPGFLGPWSGAVQLDVDAGLQHTVCRRSSQTGRFWYDPSAPQVHATLLVDPATPDAFGTLAEAVQAAGPGDRIKLVAQSLGWFSYLDKPVHLDVAPGIVLPSFLPIDLAPGERASITGGSIGTLQFWGPAAEVTLRGAVCRNITLVAGHLRCEGVTVLGGTHEYDPETAFAIWGDAGSRLTLEDSTVTGTAGFISTAFGFPTTVHASPALRGPISATIVHSTLTGGGPGTTASGAPALDGVGPTLIAGASTLTTSAGMPAFNGLVQVTSDVTWNGNPLPGALPAIAWIATPPTSPLGQTLTIDTAVPPGELLLVAIGERIDPVPLPSVLLPLQIDPQSVAVAGALAAPGGAIAVAVPNLAALEGLETWWQGVSLAGNALQLTNLRSVVLR